MNRIVKSELYKYKINKYYLLAVIFSVVGCLLAFFMMKLTIWGVTSIAEAEGASVGELQDKLQQNDTFAQIFVGNMGSFLTNLLALLVTLIVCRDRNSGVMRNMVASGNSRRSIFFGRLSATLITAVICFAIHLVCSFGVSFLYEVSRFDLASAFVPMLFRFLFFVIITLIFYGISSLIGNTVVSLIVNLLFTQILSGILAVAANLLNIKSIAEYDISNLGSITVGTEITAVVPVIIVVYLAFAAILNLIAYKLFIKKSF